MVLTSEVAGSAWRDPVQMISLFDVDTGEMGRNTAVEEGIEYNEGTMSLGMYEEEGG